MVALLAMVRPTTLALPGRLPFCFAGTASTAFSHTLGTLGTSVIEELRVPLIIPGPPVVPLLLTSLAASACLHRQARRYADEPLFESRVRLEVGRNRRTELLCRQKSNGRPWWINSSVLICVFTWV